MIARGKDLASRHEIHESTHLHCLKPRYHIEIGKAGIDHPHGHPLSLKTGIGQFIGTVHQKLCTGDAEEITGRLIAAIHPPEAGTDPVAVGTATALPDIFHRVDKGEGCYRLYAQAVLHLNGHRLQPFAV